MDLQGIPRVFLVLLFSFKGSLCILDSISLSDFIRKYFLVCGFSQSLDSFILSNSPEIRWPTIMARRETVKIVGSRGWSRKTLLYCFARQRGTQWVPVWKNCVPVWEDLMRNFFFFLDEKFYSNYSKVGLLIRTVCVLL